MTNRLKAQAKRLTGPQRVCRSCHCAQGVRPVVEAISQFILVMTHSLSCLPFCRIWAPTSSLLAMSSSEDPSSCARAFTVQGPRMAEAMVKGLKRVESRPRPLFAPIAHATDSYQKQHLALQAFYRQKFPELDTEILATSPKADAAGAQRGAGDCCVRIVGDPVHACLALQRCVSAASPDARNLIADHKACGATGPLGVLRLVSHFELF